MQDQLVFQNAGELERLRVQNALLADCEAPLFTSLFSARQGLTVLDVGCNDGTKTAARFQSDAVARVIGLEYNAALAERAQERYGSAKLSFHAFDAEAPSFPRRLRQLMDCEGIDGFDVIYLSFVLINLRDPAALLAALRRFLKPDGQLVIVEPNDGASSLTGEGGDLLGEFLAMLARDRYAGDRTLGGRLDAMLASCGYTDIRVRCDGVSARGDETERRQEIFTTFFSYFPEDVALLRAEEPENAEYRAWETWLAAHYAALRQRVLCASSELTMGLRVLTCKAAAETRRFTSKDGRTFTLRPLRREEVADAKRLCDECVGIDLYAADELAHAIDAPEGGFYLLRSDAGETAGYVYYRLTDPERLGAYSRLGAEPFRAVCPEERGRAGQLQSIALLEPYRGSDLAAHMVAFACEELAALGALAVFVACWKPDGGIVPLRRAVSACGFALLAEAHGMWYDDAELICPYCEGRCRCAAEFRYKLLDREENT